VQGNDYMCWIPRLVTSAPSTRNWCILVARTCFDSICCIIVCERDSQNDAADFMPPVLPHQLVKLQGQEFASAVRLQFDWLSACCRPQYVELIELNFQDLCSAHEREPPFKQVLNQWDAKTTFEQGWSYALERFKHLKTFCGGLATAFQGTSTVKSDFSVVKW